MMNELEQFVAMLNRAEIDYTLKVGDAVPAWEDHDIIGAQVRIDTTGDNNVGHMMFYAIFDFTSGGNLHKVGIWE